MLKINQDFLIACINCELKNISLLLNNGAKYIQIMTLHFAEHLIEVI